MDEPESWVQYRRLIISQISDVQAGLHALRDEFAEYRRVDVAEMKVEIALLKLKSSLWGGAVGALVSTVITMGAIFLRFFH